LTVSPSVFFATHALRQRGSSGILGNDRSTRGGSVSQHKVYYFGCIERAGHYMWLPGPRPEYSKDGDFVRTNPWGFAIDGSLCPKGPEIQGQALIHHKDGWTALSFWDRSVDGRGKCNSSLLALGALTFAEMVSLFKEHFPSVFGRFTFPIVEANGQEVVL
jgi:hypothetical protein